MKFFKHFTDAHEGKSMMALMSKFGVEGYGAFFILTEICAKKLEKEADRTFTEDDLKFTFNERLVREKLRMRSTKVELFLNSCVTLDLLLFTKVEDEYNFYFPKLLESMDRDSKRARTERDTGAPKKKIKNKDKEEDKDIRERIEKIYSDLYPLKKGKEKGIQKLLKDLKPGEIDLLEKAVRIYKADCEEKRTASEFIKYFSSFASEWRDYLDPNFGKSNISKIERADLSSIFGEGA